MNAFNSDGTLSVSKGFFIFKSNSGSKKKKRFKASINQETDYFSDNWYKSYRSSWKSVQVQLKKLYSETFSNILADVVSSVKNTYSSTAPKFEENIIPVAALLTGINLPDHAELFGNLYRLLTSEVSPHIATLHGRECKNVKSAIERMVSQFINVMSMEDSDDDDNLNDSPVKYKKLKKSHMNLPQLETWYKDTQINEKHCISPRKEVNNGIHSMKQLVVIIPDFESFPSHVLNDFILICSSYVPKLPFVLILGVATSALTVSHRLPITVSSKVCIQLFQTPPSTMLLNSVIEKVLLSNVTSFRLGNKAFKFLSDNFLFYDFSVEGFVQGYKMCMLEHFMGKEWTALCCSVREAESLINSFDTEQLDLIRGLPSHRLYVESLPLQERGLLLLNDNYFKKNVVNQLEELHAAMDAFHVGLSCLNILTSNLPTSPLGKNLRELYGLAISSNVTDSPDYKQCFKLLILLNLEEIIDKLDKILALIDNNKSLGMKKSNQTYLEISVKLSALRKELEGERNIKKCIVTLESPKRKNSLDNFSSGKRDTEVVQGSTKKSAIEISNFSPRRARREISFGTPRKGDTECTADTNGSTRKRETEHFNLSPRKAAVREISFDTPKKCTKTRSVAPNLSPTKSIPETSFGTPKKNINVSPRKKISESAKKKDKEDFNDSPRKNITDISINSPRKNITDISINSPRKNITDISINSPRKIRSELSLISPRKRGTESPKNEDKNMSNETPKKKSLLFMDNRMSSFKLKKALLDLKDEETNNHQVSYQYSVTQKLLKYLASEVFPALLVPLTNYPLHEIFLFDNAARIKTRVVGATRAAIHMALSNPHLYLECDCCELPTPGSLLPTLPDICIAYKLHLECGRLISLADWLQAFASIVSPVEEDSEIEIDPHVQARFTRAVDELQFLGFVKATKRKLDHVCKLTWGGS